MKEQLRLHRLSSPNLYRAVVEQPGQSDRVYGGQLICHALVAAYGTVESDRHVHSMHCYYAKFGRLKIPIDYEVERIRDGRTFSNRHVIARQAGEIVLLCECSFQKIDESASTFRLSPPFPAHVPPPHLVPLPSESQAMTPTHRTMLTLLSNMSRFSPSFEMRPVVPGVHMPLPNDGKSRLYLWARNKEPLTDCIETHCTAVFLSDIAMVVCGMQAHGDLVPNITDHTSLDHSVWIHENSFSTNQWMLYEIEAAANSNERSLVFGRLWTIDGRLILSSTQEGLIRMKAKL